jgi:CHRD domain
MRRTSLLALGAAAVMLVSGTAWAGMVSFAGTINGASEVPPVASNGMGTVVATLDTKSRTLTYSVEYSGLTTPAIAAHIHGPAPVGKNAPVLFPFKNPASPIHGSVTLTPAQVKELEAGDFYVNVHTAIHKPGEIRGQLEPVK